MTPPADIPPPPPTPRSPEERGDRPTAAARSVARPAAPADAVGGRVGPYILTGVLGEGGFGVVYAAERREPFVQRVALKVLQAGLGSADVLARFEQERQALALMEHPGVARVLDGGLTEASSPLGPGRPYFAMELVEGLPIVEHCRRNGLGIRERIELFTAVCEAVAHAHMKGVIHRDLKPSNVLVAVVDGRTRPKVIDFGIAKAIGGGMTDRPVFTERGQFLGTPEYMSPEQAAASPDVDTRTDVYSLGVILYELLAGVLPFPTDELRRAGYAEVLRIIREVEPPKPSTRVSQLSRGDAAPTTGGGSRGDHRAAPPARRHAAPATLVRELRGDLDWIVMRALEKPRARRYESPSALALDLRRYLRSEPVDAGPPSASYRLAKFVRRRRGLVAAGAVSLAALLAGLGATLYGMNEARRERDVAVGERSRADAARAQAESARAAEAKERARAESSLRFITRAIQSANGFIEPRDVSVVELLDAMRAELDARPMADAETDASARLWMSSAYGAALRTDEAVALAERAAAVLKPAGGPPAARAAVHLAMAYVNARRPADVEAAVDAGLGPARTTPDPEGPHYAAQLLIARGTARTLAGDAPGAEAALREALGLLTSGPAADPVEASAAQAGLARLILDRPGRQEEALGLASAALKARLEALGPEHPLVELAHDLLGRVHRERGDTASAEASWREALRLARSRKNPPARSLGAATHNLANLLRDADRPADAEPLAAEAAALRRAPGIPPTELAETLDLLAGLKLDRGDAPAAATLYADEVAALELPKLQAELPLSRALTGLSQALAAAGRPAEAVPPARRALEIRLKRMPDGDWRRHSTASVLADALAMTGGTDEALALIGPAAEAIWASPTLPPKRKRAILERAVRVFDAAGRADDAARWRARLATVTPPPAS